MSQVLSEESLATIANVFNKLAYEPVLDSDSTIKSWIQTHNNGIFNAFINGSYLPASEKPFFTVKNPFNGTPLAKFINCDKQTYEKAVESCRNSSAIWKQLSIIERGKILYNITRNIQKNIQILTLCESIPSGRTSREVKDLDIANIIKSLYYYAGSVSYKSSMADYEPLGIVALLGYYDSSLLTLVTKLAAALASGNTCLIVPHKLTALSAYMFMDICIQSGVPAGVINLVVSDQDDIYKWISSDSKINCISFDGKTNVGQEIIANSFAQPDKRILLNLEGKTSLVIYDSADFESAIESIVDGFLYSNGQHRFSLNKVYVQESIIDVIQRKLEFRLGKLRYGNHLDKNNDYGPMVNTVDIETLEKSLKYQIEECGSEVKQFKNVESTVFSPTVIKKIGLNSRLNTEEINGPYIMLIPFRTVKESVALINNSRFGSAVSLHSQNISLVMEVANLLDVGTVWINSFPIERGIQPRKQSGNYQFTGFRSLRNFLKPKYEISKTNQEASFDFALAQKELKTFGALPAALPTPANLEEKKTYKLYIGGKQTRPDTACSRNVLNSKNELYCLIADASRKDVRNAVEAAQGAFSGWSKRLNHNKSQIIYYFGENFDSKSSLFVEKLEILTKKSKKECEKEVKLCSEIIYHFASICDKSVGELKDTTEYGYLMEINEPLGVIAIVCGNDSENTNPLLTFILHFLAAISQGNTVVIVPDEKIPIPAVDLYEIFEFSDFPDGIVNILTGNKHHLTKYLCEHHAVNSIWYMYDLEKGSDANELHAQQFVRFTSNFNLKQNWLISSRLPINENDQSIANDYLNELYFNSTQSKYVHVTMGTIFAN